MSKIELTYSYVPTHQNSYDTTCRFFKKLCKVAKMNDIYADIFKSFMYLQYFTLAFVSILTIPPKCYALSSPLKDIMVHIAETTAFLDKKNGLDNQKNHDKHLPPV